jgi:hypothetical protein
MTLKREGLSYTVVGLCNACSSNCKIGKQLQMKSEVNLISILRLDALKKEGN